MRLAHDDETALLWGSGILLVGLAIWKGKDAAIAVADVFQRGDKLTSSTLVNGIIAEDPSDLLQQAADTLGEQITADEYALARMGRSEGVNGMVYRMHVALNDLASLQQQFGTGVYSSVEALMLRSSSHPEANGYYSEQELGKRYATTRDPYAGDLYMARKAISDHAAGIDPAQGATHFVDKSSFGVQSGTGSYEALDAKWESQGLVPFNVDGATDDFVLFRQAA